MRSRTKFELNYEINSKNMAIKQLKITELLFQTLQKKAYFL